MPNSWTPEQVLGLAPDDASRSNARTLASSARKWLRLAIYEQAIWGECQGSGSDPYRCQVDLNGPGFKCSCPSRKSPCKHALGLFLMYASFPAKFEVSTPPEWVVTWLAKRAEQSEKRAARSESKPAAPEPGAQARRAAERDKKIRAGIDDLDTWLYDLLRQGLALAQNQSHSFWELPAGRLVDAQAPGLARMVRDMAGLAASGEGWLSRLLEQAARLYLAMEGYRRIDSLPPETQADLRSVIGITQKQEEVLSGSGVKDTWLVLGRDIEEEANLKTQRVWLWGANSNHPALILNFSAAGAPLDVSLAPGSAFCAELVYYPSAYPLRAVIAGREPAIALPDNMPGWNTLLEASGAYAAALAQFPWLERFPMAINNVIPGYSDGEWKLYDAQQRCLPLAKNFLYGWDLLAISGGHPCGVFGEWNGERMLPLSAWAAGEFYPFKPHTE